MYTFEFLFYPKSFEEPFINEFDYAMENFTSSLCSNGQIMFDFINTVKYSDHYAYRVVAPEPDSLNEKYYNKYCKQDFLIVSEMSLKEPELRLIGENYNFSDSCSCENSSHYVLYTENRDLSYPVVCGDCERNVPIYKLPRTYDNNNEYYDVWNWQYIYHACDKQFMYGMGERHGYKMMNDIKSPLSVEGLRICALWENLVQKPFYYFLFKYYRKNKPICPKCNENWVNHNKDIKFEYVCEKCRLVSNDICSC